MDILEPFFIAQLLKKMSYKRHGNVTYLLTKRDRHLIR